MIRLITENIGTVIVCAVLLVIVVLAVRSIALNRKKGRGSCGCGCAHCPSAEICRKKG